MYVCSKQTTEVSKNWDILCYGSRVFNRSIIAKGAKLVTCDDVIVTTQKKRKNPRQSRNEIFAFFFRKL